MKKRKKKRLNLAMILMIVASICLSTVQVGFSFFSQSMLIGGSVTISSSSGENTGNTALDIVKTNVTITENLSTWSNASWTSGSDSVGYSAIIQGASADRTSINNYLVFSEDTNATKWRIVGWTTWGIKIVRDEALSNSTVWDTTGSTHYVNLPSGTGAETDTEPAAQNLPYNHLLSDLTGASSICTYLNGTYYTDYIANSTNADYIPSQYINACGQWDITPMQVSSSSAVYMQNMTAGNITCQALSTAISSTFVGLPVGLLNMVERCMTSSTYDPTNATASGKAFMAGWLTTTTGSEMTLTDRTSKTITTTSYSSTAALYTQSGKVQASAKNKSGTYFRPALYIHSSIVIEALSSTSTDKAGSITNPFIVKGLSTGATS